MNLIAKTTLALALFLGVVSNAADTATYSCGGECNYSYVNHRGARHDVKISLDAVQVLVFGSPDKTKTEDAINAAAQIKQAPRCNAACDQYRYLNNQRGSDSCRLSGTGPCVRVN